MWPWRGSHRRCAASRSDLDVGFGSLISEDRPQARLADTLGSSPGRGRACRPIADRRYTAEPRVARASAHDDIGSDCRALTSSARMIPEKPHRRSPPSGQVSFRREGQFLAEVYRDRSMLIMDAAWGGCPWALRGRHSAGTPRLDKPARLQPSDHRRNATKS